MAQVSSDRTRAVLLTRHAEIFPSVVAVAVDVASPKEYAAWWGGRVDGQASDLASTPGQRRLLVTMEDGAGSGAGVDYTCEEVNGPHGVGETAGDRCQIRCDAGATRGACTPGRAGGYQGHTHSVHFPRRAPPLGAHC